MIKYITLAFSAFITLNSVLSAQDEDKEQLKDLPTAKKGDRICRCISAFIPQKDEVFYFKMDGDYHEVNLPSESISVDFPVRGTLVFSLYKKTTDEENEIVYTPVLEAKLEGAGTQFIVVARRAKDELKLLAKSYNISKTNFAANGIYLFNESPVSLGISVQETKAVVKPYEQYSYPFKNIGRNTYTSAKVVMRYNEETKIMGSKRLRLIPGRRVLMFCYPSKTRAKMGATPLRVFTLQDMP